MFIVGCEFRIARGSKGEMKGRQVDVGRMGYAFDECYCTPNMMCSCKRRLGPMKALGE